MNTINEGKKYHIDGETFRVYTRGKEIIIEWKWGEWAHDFTPSYVEELFLPLLTIKKDMIPKLIKLLRKLEEEYLKT